MALTGETVLLDDMRLFAGLAEARSFTAASARLGVSKQTLSRRIAELERALGATLVHRTTRAVKLSEAGAAYAERCAVLVRLADDANRALRDAQRTPRGLLRVTADPVFGEAFLSELVVAYARAAPEVRVEVVLTRRRVDLVDERFDAAFRVGRVDDPRLAGLRLGPARVRYCASPGYLKRHGAPASPTELAGHDLLAAADEGPVVWPFRGGRGGVDGMPITPRLATSSLAMARAAALGGLGIALLPAFVCADDLRRKRLVSVLDAFVVDPGAVWLIYPHGSAPPSRVRAFVDLARARFAKHRPWA